MKTKPKTKPKPKTPRRFTPATGSGAYVWEVTTIIPHLKEKGKKARCSMLLVAHHIDQVWEYLAADRADAATEVEMIHRAGPVVATLPPNNDYTTGVP